MFGGRMQVCCKQIKLGILVRWSGYSLYIGTTAAMETFFHEDRNPNTNKQQTIHENLDNSNTNNHM